MSKFDLNASFNDDVSLTTCRRLSALLEVGRAMKEAAKMRGQLDYWLTVAAQRAKAAHDEEGALTGEIADAAGVSQEQAAKWVTGGGDPS